MSEIWGDLPKSQIDPSTVDEEIDLKIATHEADPDAHLEVGESLQSHKASEIIDHLARSIVTDKLIEGCVTPIETSYDTIVIRPTFESLDSWLVVKNGVDSDVLISPGQCQIICGAGAGNKTFIAIEGFIDPLAFDDHAWFVLYLSLEPLIDIADACFGMGDYDPFDTNDFFGFFFDQSAVKLYARITIDSTIHDVEIVGADLTGYHSYRAEMLEGAAVFNFYIDTILVSIIDSYEMDIDSVYHFSIGVMASDSYSGGAQLIFSNLTIVEI